MFHQFLELAASYVISLDHGGFQEIVIFVDIVEMGDKIVRVLEVGKDKSESGRGTDILEFLYDILLGGKNQFDISVGVSVGGNSLRYIKNLVVKKTWGAFLVKVRLDRRYPLMKQKRKMPCPP